MNQSLQRFCIVCLLSLLLCTTATSNTKDETTHVKAELQVLIDNLKVRTAVIVTVDGDSSEVLGLGEISDELRQLPSRTTSFEIGSITKVFTALLVQTLVDQELLNWDDTLTESLEEVEIQNDLVANVTLRELATHRSGLPRLPTNFTLTAEPGNPMDPYSTYGELDLISFLESFDPITLSKAYSYSNLGFAILGYVAAKTLNASYSTALEKQVFQPIGMVHSTASDSEETLAAGYSNTANMDSWNFNIHAGAGAIRSTAQDLLLFIQKNLAGEEDAISNALNSIRELQFESEQALGWSTEISSEGNTVFVHAGQTGGYASYLAIDPATERGWAILTTSTEAEIIGRLGASFYRDVPKPETVDLTPYTGVYQLAENVYMTISDNDGKLQAQVSGQSPFLLQHQNEHSFTLDDLEFEANFELGEDGNATVLNWSQPGAKINAKRVEDKFGIVSRTEVEIDNELLQMYVGEYRLTEKAKATVSQIEDRIFIQVTGQPKFRVFPMSPTRFFFKVLDAEIEFEQDEDGNITGLVLYQNGEYRAPRVKSK